MKKIVVGLVLAFCLSLTAGCWSAGSITEDYQKTPARAKSVGEGRKSYTFVYKGKNYVLTKGADGKYYAVDTPESSKIVVPSMPAMPEGVR